MMLRNKCDGSKEGVSECWTGDGGEMMAIDTVRISSCLYIMMVLRVKQSYLD